MDVISSDPVIVSARRYSRHSVMVTVSDVYGRRQLRSALVVPYERDVLLPYLPLIDEYLRWIRSRFPRVYFDPSYSDFERGWS